MNAAKSHILSIIIAFSLFISPANATHSITQWKDNRSGAVSLTFADGYENQILNAVPLLNERKFKATFFIITGESWFSGHNLTWQKWRDVAEQGHEIGSHTVTHAHLTQLSDNAAREELLQSREAINLNIPSQSCISLNYPFNDYDDRILSITREYYTSAAIKDYNGWDPAIVKIAAMSDFHAYLKCAGENTPFEQKMECLVQTIKQDHNWFIFYWHGISDEEKDSFEDFIDYQSDEKIWVDTFGNISRYLTESNYSTLSVVSEDNSEIKLNVTASLDQQSYDFPLTIRSTVPAFWNEVQIDQGDSGNRVTPVEESDGATVYYDVIPNGGLIRLSPFDPAPPLIAQTPASLSQSAVEGNNAAGQTLTIWNAGGDILSYSLTADANWLSFSPDNGNSTGDKDTVSLSYSTNSLPAGTYHANILIRGDSAENSPQTVPVTLKINTSTENEDRDGDGFTKNQGDCDDTDNTINPAAIEICGDGIDQDCDGGDLDCILDPMDIDNDGDGFTENQGDCDDSDDSVHPGATEICEDGIDQDCDASDEECSNKNTNDGGGGGGGCFIAKIKDIE